MVHIYQACLNLSSVLKMHSVQSHSSVLRLPATCALLPFGQETCHSHPRHLTGFLWYITHALVWLQGALRQPWAITSSSLPAQAYRSSRWLHAIVALPDSERGTKNRPREGGIWRQEGDHWKSVYGCIYVPTGVLLWVCVKQKKKPLSNQSLSIYSFCWLFQEKWIYKPVCRKVGVIESWFGRRSWTEKNGTGIVLRTIVGLWTQ